MLARNGYGVLLLDPRGQGSSEGDLVRWAGDRDLIAGADFSRPAPTSIPTGSAASAPRSAARSCSSPLRSRPSSRRSSPRARASRSETPTWKAGRAWSSRRSGHDAAAATGVLEPRPAAADRRPHRPDLAAPGLPHLRRAGHGRRGTSGSRSTTPPPASRSRCGRFQAPNTPAASTPARPSTSGASSASSTKH